MTTRLPGSVAVESGFRDLFVELPRAVFDSLSAIDEVQSSVVYDQRAPSIPVLEAFACAHFGWEAARIWQDGLWLIIDATLVSGCEQRYVLTAQQIVADPDGPFGALANVVSRSMDGSEESPSRV